MSIRERWESWAELWDQRESPRTLALVRIGVGAVITFDLAEMARLELVVPIWGPAEVGGLGNPTGTNPVPWLYALLPATADTAWFGWAVAFGAALFLTVGIFPRLSALVLLVLYAQFARVLSPADRGIDLLLRNIVAILALSGSGNALSLADLLGRSPGARLASVPSWPRHLIVLQIAVMYFAAGLQKTAVAWSPLGGFSALYIVLQDPAIARVPFGWLRTIYPLTQLATAATMAFEYTAALIPLVYWYRLTRQRAGWLRAQCNRVAPLRLWVLVGVLLHMGIAMTMNLGIFPWAMLAMYPAFVHPDEWPRFLRAKTS